MTGFRLNGNMTNIAVIAMLLCFALAEPALAADDESSALAAEYSSVANQCTICHNQLRGKQTAHDVSLARMDTSAGSVLPMADGEHYCEACHGSAAAHMKRQAIVGRVPPPMTFDQPSPAQGKNTVCLACHDDQSRSHWTGSPHDIKGTACVDCHVVHAEHDQVMSVETQSSVCYECHEGKQRAEQADVTLHIIENDQSSCSACHDSHAGAEEMKCLSCHLLNVETLAGQPPKARGFHHTTIKNNLSCLRCHRGVAHGVPGWVEEISKKQQQADD